MGIHHALALSDGTILASPRRDVWHQVTHWLVDTYGAIVLEDLNLNFMLRSGSLARAAHDVSIGIFREMLAYKAVEAGCQLATVNPA